MKTSVGCSRGNPEGGCRLTPQPFLPKLRLSNYMPGKAPRLRIFALVLGIVFLAAQFHFCADLTSDPTTSHICPLCSVAGSAVLTPPSGITLAPVMDRLESALLVVGVSKSALRAKSPRAPPSL